MKIRILFIIYFFATQIAYSQYSIENLGSQVNTKNSEVRPTISADGKTLYFVVENNSNPSKNKKNDKAKQEAWFSELNSDGTWGQAMKCSEPINGTNKDNAIFWTSVDGSKILIRGTYENRKYQGRGFSFCTKTSTGWSAPIAIKIKGYNNLSVDKYDGAFLTNDGKTMLLYLSEEKNSWLNDIYVSQLQNENEWTLPQKIISDSISLDDYDEISPYIASDNITMYFSSDRPGGYGGYDIWMTKRLDDTWLHWSNPVNIGDSVNSDKWEAYFTLDAKADYGYLATTRNSLGEIDLCKIKLKENQKPKSVTLLQGKIYNADNNEELTNVTLTYQVEGSDIPVLIESSNQVFKTILPYGKKYTIIAKSEGFETLEEIIDLTILGPYQEMHKDLFLHPVKKEIVDSLNNKDSSDNVSKEINQEQKELNDNSNSSNSKDSKKKSGKKNTGKQTGKEISNESESNQNSTNQNSTNPKSKKTKPNKNIEQAGDGDVVTGDVFTVNNILFDFAKSNLKNSSYRELNKVVKMMKENEAVKIELSAHTDNVGSNKYNFSLSKARAKSSKKYLISKGISSKRISTKGYGESKPIATNKTAKGRKQNRRVEVKITSSN